MEAAYYLDGKDKGKYEIYKTKRQNVGLTGSVGVYGLLANFQGNESELTLEDYKGKSFELNGGIRGPWISGFSKFWAPKPQINDNSGFKSLFNKDLRLWSVTQLVVVLVLVCNGVNKKHLYMINNFKQLKSNILVYLLLCLLCFKCDNRSSYEIYKQGFLKPSSKGVVKRTELWRGGLLVIYFNNNIDVAQINNNHKVLEQIENKDFFIKKPNSNKCLIKP